MSDEQRPGDIAFEVPGEWFVIAGYIQDLLRQKGGPWTADVVARVPAHCDLSTRMGDVRVIGNGTTTKIKITMHPWGDDSRVEWEHIASQTKRFVGDTHSIRRAGDPNADDAIEHYYRSRARGSRVTLRKVAEEMGFNYSYLRAVKAEYDKRGGWGSKKTLGDTKHLTGDKRD